MNLETIIDMLSWYKILPLNGFNNTRAKPKLLRRRKEVCQHSWKTDRKFYIQRTRWILGEDVKFYHGITALHSTMRKRRKWHLPAPGAALNVLTQEQPGYTGVEIEGPFSRVVTTVRKDWLFTSSPHSYIERLSPLSSLVRLGTPLNTHGVTVFPARAWYTDGGCSGRATA